MTGMGEGDEVEFTYDAYRNLLLLIEERGYFFTDYLSYNKLLNKKCCILRHDIDNSIEKAYKMFRIEKEMGIVSTYFVLLTSEFYNTAAARNVKLLREMHSGGCNIGLHFDETAYSKFDISQKIHFAEKERDLLESILELPIRVISMHRPSKETLDAKWHFEKMINSYSDTFFLEFKYLSDSRRRWREPVLDIVSAGQYNQLHILTHPFWYNDTEVSLHDNVLKYINSANYERYEWMQRNITNFCDIMDLSEVEGEDGFISK